MTDNELIKAFQAAALATKFATEPTGITGRYKNDPNVTEDLPPGWIWARQDGEDVYKSVRNINVRTDRGDIAVVFEPLRDGSQQVKQVDPIAGPEAFGDAATDMNQPDTHHEMQVAPVPNRMLNDLRLRLAMADEGNAMTVVLEAGIYEDADGQLVYEPLAVLDTTSLLPSSGMKVPVILGLNGTTIVTYSGDELALSIPPEVVPYFEKATYLATRNAATGADVWLWGLPLRDGMTGFQSTDEFQDLRPYLSLAGADAFDVTVSVDAVSNPPTQEELASAFGAPSDVGPRFLGILDDSGAGTKPYAVLSDGQQFLGVPAVVFRSGLATSSWVRQGAVLTPRGGSETLMAEPCVMFEGNPQLLTGLPRVFKMWYRAGTGTTAPGFAIYYAESPDGLIWTRRDTPLVSSCFSPHVVKVSGTYYLYVAGGLYAHIDVYTSSDGIDFTLDTANVIVPGTGWESAYSANPFVWLEGSAWKMLYEAQGTKWSIGLATSSDGRAWTKYASNPVISATGMRGGPCVYKLGANYYCYGQGRVGGSGNLPTDIVRNQSTDLMSWGSEVTFLARSGTDEGAATSVGQVADPSIVIVNGVAYVFYAATPDGTDDDGTIKLITGKPGLLVA